MYNENNSFKDLAEVKEKHTINRRTFLKITGGGILLYYTFGKLSFLAPEEIIAAQEFPSDFNAYLKIGTDGRVTCFTGKIEMGQGVVTSLVQMLADELDVDYELVDIIMGDTDLCPYDMGTFGSMSTRYFGAELRKAGAAARKVLIEMGAETLKVSADKLDVNKDNLRRTCKRK